MTRRLIALDLEPSPAFVTALRRAWDAGDAVLPLDQRLPAPARLDLARRLGAAARLGDDLAETRLDGGVPTDEGDALVVATSGTTGNPKGVVLTMEALAAHAEAVHERLGVTAADRWLACLPLAHVGGLGVVTRALLMRTDLEVLPRFDPDALRSAAARGATLVSLVPATLDRIDPALFRRIVLGGSGDRRARPGNVVHTYGLTESAGGVVYDGRPLRGFDVRVVDTEGSPLGAGGHGAIELLGPSLLRRYRDGTDPRTADGWLPTGDAGHLDAAGALTVEGRTDEMIVTGGENVWPQQVEAALLSHPLVAEVAVTGRPDPEWGARVVAVVVPAGEAPTLAELRAHAQATLPAFAAPRELVLVKHLPRTALGKVRRQALTREGPAPSGHE